VHAGDDLGVLVDELNVGARPSGAEPHDVRRFASIIALLGSERFVLAIERAGQVGTEHAEPLLRRIDRHVGIHLPEHR
jgi:hypothetical protein